MSSFQAKLGWKRPRKGESKNYRSDHLLVFQPKQVGNGLKREKIKIIVPFRSYPTCYRKFQKYQKNSKN